MYYSNYCNRDPFVHYRIRANVYKLLERGVDTKTATNHTPPQQLIDISSDSVMHKGIPIAIVRVGRKIPLTQYIPVVLEN